MEIPKEDVIEVTDLPVRLLDVLFTFNLVDSKTEGKRLIAEGAITVNGQKVTDVLHVISELPLMGIQIMRSRRRRIWLQRKFPDDDRWNTKVNGPGGRYDFEIELLVESIAGESGNLNHGSDDK